MAMEKEGCLILFLLLMCFSVYARQSAVTEDILEKQEKVLPVTDDIPAINLNTADVRELQSLHLLTPAQINSFLQYRKLLGKLLSIYELQAIPGFDTTVINQLLPYVRIENSNFSFRNYFSKGEHTLLLRYARDLPLSKGYLTKHYLGSPDKLLLRYRYSFPSYASWGISIEKDPGEKRITDFYSAHLFIKNYKYIKALALGDFTVNMGQGLINWQSMVTGKGAAVMQIKQENDLLRPYTSAGEFYFYRGAGITVKKGNWESTGFISLRHPDLSIDTLTASLVSTGYHRTYTELEKEHLQKQVTTGANLSVIKDHWHTGINIIHHSFSKPLQKVTKPYDQFIFTGTNLTNISIDYSRTWRNIHFFGEAAISDNSYTGILSGMIASISKQADISLLYRRYDKRYQTLYANAFGEFYRPVNEQGLYTAISIKLTPQITLNTFADVFSFPWLQYKINQPGNGKEMLLSLIYTPDKRTEVFIRYCYIEKLQNDTESDDLIQPSLMVSKKSWRCQTTVQPATGLTIKARAEINNIGEQQGSLLFTDIKYKNGKWDIGGRYTKFTTDGTTTSMYVMSNSILYEYVLSRLYGKGVQYQLGVKWTVMRYTTLWARFEQEVYDDVKTIGSGWDMISANKKNTIVFQIRQSI